MSTGGSKRPATGASEPKGNEASPDPKKSKNSSEETVPSMSSGEAASGGTPAAATVMSYGDDVRLMDLLKEEDFKTRLSYSLLSGNDLGHVRKQREENSDFWMYVVGQLEKPEILMNALDQTSYELDVNALDARIKMIETWHTDSKIRDKHLAPLFAIIQSSGTEKSRLMNCVRNTYRKNTSRTILLAASAFDEDKKTEIKKDFDDIYIVQKNDPITKQKSEFDAFVRDQCSKALKKSGDSNKTNKQFVRLFFDEAQHLAHNDGFLLKVLRWITREIDSNCFLTVVLAGTNSDLAYSFWEPKQRSRDSRTIELKGQYYEEGTVPFDCLSLLSSDKSENWGAMSTNKSEYASEYESMIQEKEE